MTGAIGNAVHFGAGALGRGLVVPRLVAAGWSVTVVDPVADLVRVLRAEGGYSLHLGDATGQRSEWIALAAAVQLDDRIGLAACLGHASLITTAVRKENLPAVATQLATAWRGGGCPRATVIACENVERVDEVLTDAFRVSGLEPDRLAQLDIPRTVVDRICASDWPTSTMVRTEPYAELATSSIGSAIPGIEQARDIDGLFARKRYLVNSLADAAAILGRASGQMHLADPFEDDRIQAELAPFVVASIRHLVLAHGFGSDDLESYRATSIRRLGNRFVPRRLDTVARDIRRKLQPTERFLAPLIDLERRGEDNFAALRVVARLVEAGAALDRSDGHVPFTATDAARAAALAEDDATRSVCARLAEMMSVPK